MRLAANHAVIVDVAFLAIEREAVNEAGFEIGDEELLCLPVKRNVAEPRPGVVAIIEFDIGEKGNCTGLAVDLVDRTGCAVLVEAKLAGHPLGTWRAIDETVNLAVLPVLDDLQSEHRGRSHVDIGCLARAAIVQRHAKHLA